jgi:hypothetical protein
MFTFYLTNYKRQGQTLDSLIIGIQKPPHGRELNIRNLYVAISCNMQGIVTLQDIQFEDLEKSML